MLLSRKKVLMQAGFLELLNIVTTNECSNMSSMHECTLLENTSYLLHGDTFRKNNTNIASKFSCVEKGQYLIICLT